jgi:hypothetical protein
MFRMAVTPSKNPTSNNCSVAPNMSPV